MAQALGAARARLLPLVVLGASMEIVYLGYFVRRFPVLQYYRGPYMDLGQISGHTRPALVGYVIACTTLFVLYGLAWWVSRDLDDEMTLWTVLGFGALFAVTLAFVYPVTALDVFAYIDQSLVMVQYHQNPIFTPPAAFGSDPLMSLSGGWGGVPAPYGPLGVVVDAVPTLLVGRNLLANLMILRLMFSAMAMVEAYLVYRILRSISPRAAVSGALLVSWSPYILFETSANGHNDIAMMLFVLLGFLSMVEGELTIGVVLVAASALVKYGTLLLLPLVLMYGLTRHSTWQERARYLLVTCLSVAVLVTVVYAPFWKGLSTLNALQFQNQRYLYSLSTLLNNLSSNNLSLDRAAFLGRVVFVPVYLYALSLCARDLHYLVRASFLAMFGFFLLANTNFLYWYAVSVFILAAACPDLPERLCAFFMACAIEIVTVSLNIYVWVLLGVTSDSFRPINNVSYLAMFALPALILLVTTLRHEGRGLGLGARGVARDSEVAS